MTKGINVVRNNRHDEYDTYIEWYENQINNKEVPSVRYRQIDKIRHKNLAFENGEYDIIASKILLTDSEIKKSVLDFRKVINEFRRNQGWEEYI